MKPKIKQAAKVWRKEAGYTLVEMLLVLTITVVLATLVWKVSYEKLEQNQVEWFLTTLEFRIKEIQNYAMEHNQDVVLKTGRAGLLETELSFFQGNSSGYVPWWTWQLPPYISDIIFRNGDATPSRIIFSPTGQMKAIYIIEVQAKGKKYHFVLNLQRGRITKP